MIYECYNEPRANSATNEQMQQLNVIFQSTLKILVCQLNFFTWTLFYLGSGKNGSRCNCSSEGSVFTGNWTIGIPPPTFAFSYNSLLHCIAMGNAFVYFVHFVLPYIIDQDQEAFHAGCWWLAKFWLVGNWIKRRCKYISLSNLLNVEEKAELQFAEH